MIKELTCAYCDSVAVSGVDSVERDEYYPVCEKDLDRLVNDFKMISVELVTDYECVYCGEIESMTNTHWEC